MSGAWQESAATSSDARNDDLIVLRSDHIEVTIDPRHGAEILSICAPGGTNALSHHSWDTPSKARDGQRYGTTSQDWLSDYRGGWQECFPNVGAESTNAGTITPFHGEASTTAWTVLTRSTTEVTLQVAAHVPLMLTRTMRLGHDAPTLFIEERVDNVGPLDLDYLWGHHPVFPATPGAVVDLPDCTVDVEPTNSDGVTTDGGRWPSIPGPGGPVDISTLPATTTHRLTYQHPVTDGWVALRQPSDSAHPSMAMAWDLDTWPHLWMWLLAETPEFPWFGRARMIGLEPNRAWPFDGLDGAVSRQQQLRLPAGGHHEAWLTFRLLTDNAPLGGMDQAGTLERLD